MGAEADAHGKAFFAGSSENIRSVVVERVPLRSTSAPTPFPYSLGGFSRYGTHRAVRLYPFRKPIVAYPLPLVKRFFEIARDFYGELEYAAFLSRRPLQNSF